MSEKSKRVKVWRKRTKQRMVDSFGGKCGICNYDICLKLLQFHHLDRRTKSFTLSDALAVVKSWKIIVIELRKCVCLCGDCHRGVHYRGKEIPKNIKRFDERYVDYYLLENPIVYNKCFCGNSKLESKKYCSHKCAWFARRKVKRPSKDQLLKEYNMSNYSAMGRKYGVCDKTIKKWLK